MISSIETTQISKALIEAQAEFPVISFDKTNPYFNSRYATLGAIIGAMRPILIKYGLYVLQFPVSNDNGNVGVTTRLIHSSGEWFEETVMVPLQKASEKTQIAQVAGIDITYLRRYSYGSVLGLYAEEDTDGGIGDGYEKAPKQVREFSGKKTKVKKASRVPAVPEEEAGVNSLEGLLEEFGHKWNKARALGNEPKDLPKIKDPSNEQDVIEKLAELEIILKESEE